MFTWIPLLAVVVSAVVSKIPLRRSQQIALVCGAVATVVLIGASALQLASDLSSTERGDWKALSTTIEAQIAEKTVVILEHLRPLGLYRSPFAGKPRYLPPERRAPRALDIIHTPELVETERPIAIASSGSTLKIPGWQQVSVDEVFSLYIPNSPVAGPIEAANALLLFSMEVDADRGATLALAGASLYLANESEATACAIIADLRADEDSQSGLTTPSRPAP
jgi:hypothetical protein